MEAEARGDGSRQRYEQIGEQQMEIIDWVRQGKNPDEAIKAVKSNKGAAGID